MLHFRSVTWWPEKKAVTILLLLFVIINTAYLHRVPGLMGDEASEGANVCEKLEILTGDATKARAGELLQGERSYIGPAIDYGRLPFIWLFGATPLALRLPMLLAAGVTFWLSASVFRRLFGADTALLILAVVFFSPMYLTMHRLGWAITLQFFFAVLIIWLLTNAMRWRYFLAGAAAGLGLHNHILFLPTLTGILVALSGTSLWPMLSRKTLPRWPAFKRALIAAVSLLVGLALVFSTQYVALRADTSDQGDPAAVAELVGERTTAFFAAAPLYLSGSSYIARYTGQELTSQWRLAVTTMLFVLCLIALAWAKQRRSVWLWALGLAVHLALLLTMIDRFTLRYFTVFSLGAWVLAAVGLATLLPVVNIPMLRNIGTERVTGFVAVGLALVLSMFFAVSVLLPFLQTGGSTNDFSLGNRTNSAADLADTRPLITCLRGQGTVSSENVHIWNRLQYVSHHYPDVQVLPEQQLAEADFTAHYRDGKTDVDPTAELCLDLPHFIVERQ